MNNIKEEDEQEGHEIYTLSPLPSHFVNSLTSMRSRIQRTQNKKSSSIESANVWQVGLWTWYYEKIKL